MKKASILQPVNPNLPAPPASSNVSVGSKAAKLVPFLKKLQNLSEQCPQDIGHWSCDGKQFDVVDPTRFSSLVLKEHFPNSNTKTFFRQLFYYGFTQLNIMNGGGDERTKGTFSIRHPSFLRDSPSRIFEIKRSAKAGGQVQTARDENDDGDHRVDVLEQRLSALQSIVDDLSRKLAVLQFQTTSASATAAPPPPPPPVQTNKSLTPPSRKRMHQEDEEDEEDAMEEQVVRMGSFEEDYSRLATDEIFSLFDSNAATTEPEELEQNEESFEDLLASDLSTCPPTPGLSPPPVQMPTTTAPPASTTLSTQKLLAVLSTVAGCSKQVRDVGDRNKISSSSQDAPMMSV